MPNRGSASNYILFAEDNPADVELVREALKERSVTCNLHVVADGEQAISFIEQIDRNSALACPKLLLLGLKLPKRDGEQILRHLRASERCGQTAVVILTSSDSPRDIENATRHAALHYFRKPADLEQFMAPGDVVRGVIERERDGSPGPAAETKR